MLMLLWALFTFMCAPSAATLHALSHIGGSVSGSTHDEHNAHCDTCAQWEALGDVLLTTVVLPEFESATTFQFRSPAISIDTALAHWFQQRAPPSA